MAAWAVLLLVLLVAMGVDVDGQMVAGPGQLCRSGGNILPINCAAGLTCIVNTSSPNPDVAKTGTCQTGSGGVSNATLALYNVVKARNTNLINALVSGDFLSIAKYVTVDVQIVLPNVSTPLTLANISSLLQFAQFLTPTPAAPVTIPVDLLFKLVDTANVITVQELALGQFGNAYITAVWRFSNVTNDWLVSFGDVVPAPAGPIPNVTLPLFLTTPNATANATANASAANSTSIQRAVISASNGLLAAIGSANESVANATSQYVGPELEIVLATQPSPSAFNVSDPTIIALVQELRSSNSPGGLSGQAVVAYKQFNPTAVFFTSVVYNAVQNAFFTQLWQYLPSANSTTTTTSWQLTFASINVAPPGAAPVVLAIPS
jgi:hypothetical protein